MAKKEGNFFELYIEKIVLVLVGIIAAFLLIFFVVLPPSKVKFDNRTFTASNVDDYINKEAQLIKGDYKTPPSDGKIYISVKNEFQEIIDKAFVVDPQLFATLLPIPTADDSTKQKYNVPHMIEIDNVAAELVRTVAYVPLRDVSLEMPYTEEICEPNDIDIVTVQGQIDTTVLYENFKEVFAGENVQENWRDLTLAKPVFAAVHLQRQELLTDGAWSNFADIPRAKIEINQELFQIVQDVEELPVGGGLNIRVLLYSHPEMQAQLIQPQPYVMATEEEQWMPPAYHYQYQEIMTELKDQLARQIRQDRRKGIKSNASTAGGRGGRGGETTRSGEQDNQLDIATELNKLKKDSQELTLLYENFQSREINEDTDLENTEKPLLFWAFDDTVMPSKSYRYRIRLGVFNPIAGTEKFTDPQHPQKDDCILFSKFVDAKQIVTVPKKTFFFPVSKASNSTKISVDVYTYKLGHWYKNNFAVSPGEMIGKILENSEYNTEDVMATPMTSGGRGGAVASNSAALKPPVINYNTKAMYLDYTKIENWSGSSNIYRKPYYEMIYCQDGEYIVNMPVAPDGRKHWGANTENTYKYLNNAEKQMLPSLINWKQNITSTKKTTTPATTDYGTGGGGMTYNR